MKVTETTPPNQRKFTIALNEEEGQALHTLIAVVDKWHNDTPFNKMLREIEVAFEAAKVPYHASPDCPFAAGGAGSGCLLRTVAT